MSHDFGVHGQCHGPSLCQGFTNDWLVCCWVQKSHLDHQIGPIQLLNQKDPSRHVYGLVCQKGTFFSQNLTSLDTIILLFSMS